MVSSGDPYPSTYEVYIGCYPQNIATDREAGLYITVESV